MKNLVSIIIPVYNVEKYLDECILSVLNQKYRNFEVILINDGSTDGSLDICKKYEKIDNRVKVISVENGGISKSRNLGVNNAVGEYIYFLDSDDYIGENFLNEIIPYMNMNDLDICYFSSEMFYEGNVDNLWNEDVYIKKHEYSIDTGKNIFSKLLKNNEYVCQNCMFITKSNLIKENNFQYIEGIYYEDILYSYNLLLSAKKASVLKEVYYYRRVREGSIMTDKTKMTHKIKSAKRIIDEFLLLDSDDFYIHKYIKNTIFYHCILILDCLKAMNVKYDKDCYRYFKKSKMLYNLSFIKYFILKFIF